MRLGFTGAVCVSALVALGCGSEESGSRSGSGEEKQVRAVVQEAMTTDDPGACTRLLTQGFLEQVTLERGRAAVRSCRADADQVAAKTLSIDGVTVDGAGAEAKISPSGGTLPFDKATLALRKSGGRWRLSRLRAGTLDRAAFGRVLRSQLAGDDVSAETADCAVGDLAGTSDSEIVRAYVQPDPRILVVPIAVCTIRTGLARQGLPSNLINCITGGARKELTSGALGRKLAEDPANIVLLRHAVGEALGARLAHDCVRKLNLTSA
jgi:hypothetical protein